MYMLEPNRTGKNYFGHVLELVWFSSILFLNWPFSKDSHLLHSYSAYILSMLLLTEQPSGKSKTSNIFILVQRM